MGAKLSRSRKKGRSDVTEACRPGESKSEDDEETHTPSGDPKSAATPQPSPVSPENNPTRKPTSSVFSYFLHLTHSVVAAGVVAFIAIIASQHCR